MEITGTIKLIEATVERGQNNFKTRELRITTDEQYPQILPIQFVQGKCEELDQYKAGERVTISISLRGKEWDKPDGTKGCFGTIQGWKIVRI